jgi:polyphosphate kinase
MVELKARFDESNNLVWARALERAGVHVSYGFARLKTHCKLALIVRSEEAGFRTYAHIGTGNYNPATARLYTDLGLFSSDPEICQDVSDIFNYLTGFSRQANFKKLLVAPINVRESIIDLIGQEADIARAGGKGRILFKLNALVDPEVIDALYDASQAGVEIDLVVRGICCLRPGVRGLSDNIRVRSIVGRFLEHSRIYWFGGGGSPRAYMGSADMMRRNLDRRIEVLAPVEEPAHLRYIEEEVIGSALKDNRKAWSLDSSGAYRKVRPTRGQEGFNSQESLLLNPAGRLLEGVVSPSSYARSAG